VGGPQCRGQGPKRGGGGHEGEVAYAAAHALLRSHHDVLLAALDAARESGRFLPQPEGLQEPGQQWLVFDLGAACAEGGSGALAPACRLLRDMGESGGKARPPYAPLKAQFSTMAAGVHVRAHTGPTNAKLTLHYGLRVPEGAPGSAPGSGQGRTRPPRRGEGARGLLGPRIRVANETRPFLPRGLLVFDDSFEHEVWQDGETERTTLVLHIAHPDLPRGDLAGTLA
jgi:aspartate beta-hydroxylase